MTQAISEFLSNVFQDNVILATIIIALIPLIELKGAIPFAMSEKFWGEFALSAWPALGWSVLGGFVITIILALIFKPIYNAIKDKKFFKGIVNFLTSSVKKKSEEIENEKSNNETKKLWKKIFTTTVFVAIPLPGTGVYTGTCLAIFLGLNFWQTLASVTIGNIFAGILMMTICSIFPAFTNIILYIFIALIVAFFVYRIIVYIINKKHNN